MPKFFQKKQRAQKINNNKTKSVQDPHKKHYYKETDKGCLPDPFPTHGGQHAIRDIEDQSFIEMLYKNEGYKEFPLDGTNKLRVIPYASSTDLSSLFYNALCFPKTLGMSGYKWLYMEDHTLYTGYFVNDELQMIYKTYIAPSEDQNKSSTAMLTTKYVPLAEMKPLYYSMLYPLNGLVSDLSFDETMKKNVLTRKLLRAFPADELRACVRDFVENYGLTLQQLNKITPECLQLLSDQKEIVCLLVKHDIATFEQLSELNPFQLKYVLSKPNEEYAQGILYHERPSNSHCAIF